MANGWRDEEVGGIYIEYRSVKLGAENRDGVTDVTRFLGTNCL